MPTQSQENEPLGFRLRSERLRLGLTQSALGDFGGVSKTTVLGYEAGTYVPDINFLIGIAEGGVDLNYILYGERTEEFVAAHFNWSLASDLDAVVNEWGNARPVPTSALARWQLISFFYRRLCAKGEIDSRLIEETFKVAEMGDPT